MVSRCGCQAAWKGWCLLNLTGRRKWLLSLPKQFVLFFVLSETRSGEVVEGHFRGLVRGLRRVGSLVHNHRNVDNKESRRPAVSCLF